MIAKMPWANVSRKQYDEAVATTTPPCLQRGRLIAFTATTQRIARFHVADTSSQDEKIYCLELQKSGIYKGLGA